VFEWRFLVGAVLSWFVVFGSRLIAGPVIVAMGVALVVALVRAI
jgi:hypothetical protein